MGYVPSQNKESQVVCNKFVRTIGDEINVYRATDYSLYKFHFFYNIKILHVCKARIFVFFE